MGVKLPEKPQEGLGRFPSILVAKSIVRIAPNPHIVSGLDIRDEVGELLQSIASQVAGGEGDGGVEDSESSDREKIGRRWMWSWLSESRGIGEDQEIVCRRWQSFKV